MCPKWHIQDTRRIFGVPYTLNPKPPQGGQRREQQAVARAEMAKASVEALSSQKLFKITTGVAIPFWQ